VEDEIADDDALKSDLEENVVVESDDETEYDEDTKSTDEDPVTKDIEFMEELTVAISDTEEDSDEISEDETEERLARGDFSDEIC
jgi:hypothetical protein